MGEREWTEPRPTVDRRLDGALTHRLTTLIAATGYGKSTALAGWAPAVNAVLYRIGPRDRELTTFAAGVASALRAGTGAVSAEVVSAAETPLGPDAVAEESARADALASAVTESLAAPASGHAILILDGLNVVAESPGPARFVETLVRTAPSRLHLVIASRDALPFPIVRLRQDYEVLELDAHDLALSVDETEVWLRNRLGPEAAGLAPDLYDATGGWPAATRAAIDAMSVTDPGQWGSVASDVSATVTGLYALTCQVFDELAEESQRLLLAATVVPVVTGDVAAALGVPPETLDLIASRGMFVEPDTDGYRLTATSRRALRKHRPLDDQAARDIAAAAAQWFIAHERVEQAARTALAADDGELLASILLDHGERLADYPDDVLAALDRVAPDGDDRAEPVYLRLAALAHYNRGDWDTARALLVRVRELAPPDASVALPLGVIDHLRGDLDGAIDAYREGANAGLPAGDSAMCMAMGAAARWLRGEREDCAAMAEQAREQAAALGDRRALAAAHTVLAMLAAYDGDRRANHAHYAKALDHATRAGDLAQEIRIRCNRASHWHEQGLFAEALAESEIAIGLCDLTGFTPWAALARSNRAESLIRLGRLEEAAVDASDAVARWEAIGSRLVCYGLTREAQIHVLRGQSGAAAEAFERAIGFAEQAGDMQGLSSALVGLADLRARDHPREAAALAARAAENHVGASIATACLVAARAAMYEGRVDEARSWLERAQAESDRRQEIASAARITQMRAELDNDATLAAVAVEQWSRVGDPVGLAGAELTNARLGDVSAAAEVAADVKARMLAIGCRMLDDEIEALIARSAPADVPRVAVQTLGAFRVLRDGVPVPRAAWQSRKARDLLKVLITRRGRPVMRDQLAEMLWPDAAGADQSAVLKRLNVMVSTLRAVLDPRHEWLPDHIIESKAGAVRVELSHVRVDVIEFLDQVRKAAELDGAGREAEALTLWRAAEASYVGDFCEEDVYADWATGLREEARLAYAQAAARIAEAESSRGHHELAARLWLRLLERDPYDEHAHLSLIHTLNRSGRRADAWRRYQVYADRMRELDVEPAPQPP